MKTREIIASQQGDIGIGDITHPMQLSNRGRNGRVLMPVDTRSSAVMFIIRKDLYDLGITTLEKLAAWKRPDDRKPIVSVSSLGGTNHVWSSYYMEVMGLDTKVTWIGTGNVDTMLGLAEDQASRRARELAFAAQRFQGSRLGHAAVRWYRRDDLEQVYRRQGAGDVALHPAGHDRQGSAEDAGLRHRDLAGNAMDQERIRRRRSSMRSSPMSAARRRARTSSRSPTLQKVADYDATIDAAAWARGEKVWFREMTGIKPLTPADLVSPTFIEAAQEGVSGLNVQGLSSMPSRGQNDVRRIDVRGLSKSFQLGGATIEAVRDVSFGVRRGEFVALLGPSGSGKSTILNMIATLVKPTSGEILIDGKPVIAGKATPDVGYVFQRDTLFPWRTVADNIGYGLQLAGVADAERKERVAACVAQAGLQGFEQAYPSALSGGMRQRAALMRTLVVEPQILLMDEPFGALDTHTKIDMHEVLLRIWEREQQTVLFVTHDLGEALTLGRPHHPVLRAPGRIKDMFEVDFAAAARCREGARDAALCRIVPAHLAFAGRGIHAGARVMRTSRHRGSTLAWQILICVTVLWSGNGDTTCTRSCRGWCPICSIPISCRSRRRFSSTS